MGKTASWILKSFLIGIAAGLATFTVSYVFLMVHQEVGVAPSSSLQVAILAFVFSALAALIYFRMKRES